MNEKDIVKGMSVRILNKTAPNSYTFDEWKGITGLDVGAIGIVREVEGNGESIIDFKDIKQTYHFHFNPKDIEPVNENEAFFLKWKEGK